VKKYIYILIRLKLNYTNLRVIVLSETYKIKIKDFRFNTKIFVRNTNNYKNNKKLILTIILHKQKFIQIENLFKTMIKTMIKTMMKTMIKTMIKTMMKTIKKRIKKI